MDNPGIFHLGVLLGRKSGDKGYTECPQLYTVFEIIRGVMCREIITAPKSNLRNTVYSLDDKICQRCQKCL